MTEVRLTGRLICATPDEAARVRSALPAHIALTRAEPGCLFFEVTPTENPLIWAVSERFADSAAFEAHQARADASVWAAQTTSIARDDTVTGLPE
ncbi:antibiotic biosynthesis monooxygenase [uncultured Roseobacter sp.]|uniref:putative quinol monooxygenase n=1 Tax=uncultured Roseobacter sp. TaxID=114847 RepID=UPI00262A1ADF|nr:antibiotic biosynthesis monooxygenase [uncultured Roseobacter sp.]